MTLPQRFHELFASLTRAHGVHIPDTSGKAGKQKGKSHTAHEPLTETLWANHLAGKVGLGLVPIRDDGTCRWAALDIDDYTIDLVAFERRCHSIGLPCTLCRTKSGGAHIYLFFSEPIPSPLIRLKLKKFAMALGYPKTEIFPKQDAIMSETDVGNWLNMPYFNATATTRYAFLNGKAATAEEFLVMAEERKLTLAEVDALDPISLRGDDDFSDAPPCIEMLAAQGFPEGAMNNALFSLGVYARKKFPEGWQDKVAEYNQRYMGPGSLSEVMGILKSLERKGYTYKCKDVPLCNVCNRSECYKRKFGLDKPGRKNDKDGRPCILSEVDRPVKVFIPHDKSGDEPQWIFTISGRELEVTLDMVLDQKRFTREFVRIFHRVILPVTDDAWASGMNELLAEAEELELPADAGPEGQLLLHLESFCTGRVQARDRSELVLGKPFTGRLKEHHGEDQSWFRSKDLMKYLDQQHFREFAEKEIWTILRRYGAKHTTLMIKGACVGVWGVKPFAKQNEDFDATPVPVKDQF